MTSTDDVLAQIDAAVEDWTISGDAMRSRPAQAAETQVWVAPAGTDPAADGWQPLGAIGELDMTIGEFTIDPEAVASHAPTPTWDEVRQIIIDVQAERAQRVQAIFDAIRQGLERLAAPAEQAAEAFRHLPEAVGCNDCGKPPRPRDRPAWQSTYGPAQRRRR